MNRALGIGIGVATVLALGGLGFFILRPGGETMTPQEARQRVVKFAQRTISYAAPGQRTALRHPEGLRGSCHDAFGAMNNKTSRTYTWELKVADDALADQIVARTGELWSEQGIQLRRDDGPMGVNAILGSTDEEGFGYKLIVNRNDGMAYVTIQTPCLDEGSA
jgi:hypothetical protein